MQRTTSLLSCVATAIMGLALLVSTPSLSAESFADLVGKVPVKAVEGGDTIKMPFIIWGGDVVTFHANGGLKTKGDSIYGKSGLKVELTPGDDFVQQVRDYLSGKSPFLRGTMRMMGMASEVIGKDPRTEGVMVLQMTWSLVTIWLPAPVFAPLPISKVKPSFSSKAGRTLGC